MTFENAQCLQIWQGKDEFLFCHWIAESEQDIHDYLDENGSGALIYTVCYTLIRFVSFFKQTGEPLVYVGGQKKKKKKNKKND